MEMCRCTQVNWWYNELKREGGGGGGGYMLKTVLHCTLGVVLTNPLPLSHTTASWVWSMAGMLGGCGQSF